MLLLTSLSLAVLAIVCSAYAIIRMDRARGSAPAPEPQLRPRIYAEIRPAIHLDPWRVPATLGPLVPLAEKWGIGDDVIRNGCIDQATAAEKRELHDAFYDSFERITEWLDSSAGRPLTEEGLAFMYAQKALDDMGYHILEEKQHDRQT